MYCGKDETFFELSLMVLFAKALKSFEFLCKTPRSIVSGFARSLVASVALSHKSYEENRNDLWSKDRNS